jgi:hypothetical protein
MPETHFDEWVATRYETLWPELFDPAVVDPAVSFLAELAATGPPPGETTHVFTATPGHLGFEEYDVAAQIAVSHHYWTIEGRLRTFSSPHRYVWPSELDLMARLAGLSLRERWADWNRAPFNSESRGHVSVWEKPPRP